MSRSGFTDAERARCVLWTSEGYGATAVQRLFVNLYNRHPPARSTIRLWREDYEARVLIDTEEEMDAQELVSKYGIKYEYYLTMTLEGLSPK